MKAPKRKLEDYTDEEFDALTDQEVEDLLWDEKMKRLDDNIESIPPFVFWIVAFLIVCCWKWKDLYEIYRMITAG